MRRPHRADLIQPVAVNYHSPPQAKDLERFGNPGHQRRIADPHHLGVCSGGIGQRAEDIKCGLKVQRFSYGLHMSHRRMKFRGEHKSDMGLMNALGDLLRARLDVNAQRCQHVGRTAAAGNAPIAVFGYIHARSGGNNRRGRGDIKGLQGRSAGSAGIHQVVQPRCHRHRVPAKRAGQPRQFADGGLFDPHSRQKRGNLHLGHLALKDRVQQLAGLLIGQILAFQNDFQIFSNFGHLCLSSS
ncbi:MAG: hypothetical protein BWY83_02190 [bacterium ADurb.Bin478]|nr:MAG: hypothetical protein BWY83_02190 [bacterium ADurb.Bin478]